MVEFLEQGGVDGELEQHRGFPEGGCEEPAVARPVRFAVDPGSARRAARALRRRGRRRRAGWTALESPHHRSELDATERHWAPKAVEDVK